MHINIYYYFVFHNITVEIGNTEPLRAKDKYIVMCDISDFRIEFWFVIYSNIP